MKISRLAELIRAKAFSGKKVSSECEVFSCASLEASDGDLSFYSDHRYRKYLVTTKASVVILDADAEETLPEVPYARLVHDNPPLAFAMALEIFYPEQAFSGGIKPGALIEKQAIIHETALIEFHSFVGKGAKIGEGTRLMPGAYVGENAIVGKNCILGPHSVVGSGCILGNRVRLQAGAVVGSDGFGFIPDKDDEGNIYHRKIPQTGIVRVEDDVEIGANSCIDRATTGETVIGRGTKIDNLVQVGHNCSIGPLCILCGQAGLAGSTILGKGVYLGGQVGVSGHIKLGDGVRAGAQAGIINDLSAGETVWGTPASEHMAFKRSMLALKKLPRLIKTVRRIEKKIDK